MEEIIAHLGIKGKVILIKDTAKAADDRVKKPCNSRKCKREQIKYFNRRQQSIIPMKRSTTMT